VIGMARLRKPIEKTLGAVPRQHQVRVEVELLGVADEAHLNPVRKIRAHESTAST